MSLLPSIKVNSLVFFLYLALLNLSFFAGYVFQANSVMLWTLLILYLTITIYCIFEIGKHITLLVFLITFFTFLMGRIYIPFFFDIDDIIVNFGVAEFYKETYLHILSSLFVSLLLVFLGYLTIHNKNIGSTSIDFNSDEILTVRRISKILVYITFVFAFIMAIEKIRFVATFGYFSYYLDFSSSLPYPIRIIGALFEPCVFLFLATMPSKKECKPVLLIYFLIGLSYLGFGQRGGFILYVLFIITYYFLRNKVNPGGSKWIGRKGIIMILIAIPFLVSFLYVFATIRLDTQPADSNKIMLSFLFQQGVSMEVIGFAYEYEDQLPKGKLYSIGDIIDYFNHHKIAQIFLGREPIKPQSIDRALNDHSLDAALGYIVKPHLYLRGGGLGSSYIAEAWKDLGYVGIIIFSFIYGIILASIQKWANRSVWKGAFGFIMFVEIIYSPRARAIKFLYQFFSIGLILMIIAVYLIYLYKKRSNRQIIHQL
jgi:oligosaccharide repeat unit polymerase